MDDSEEQPRASSGPSLAWQSCLTLLGEVFPQDRNDVHQCVLELCETSTYAQRTALLFEIDGEGTSVG